MDNFMPSGLTLIDRSVQSPLAKIAIRMALPLYPGCFVSDCSFFGDSAALRAANSDREVYAVVTLNAKDAKNKPVGRCYLKLHQKNLTVPFTVEEVRQDTLRPPMTRDEAALVARGFFGTPAMAGRPWGREVEAKLVEFILSVYGEPPEEPPVPVEPATGPKGGPLKKAAKRMEEAAQS